MVNSEGPIVLGGQMTVMLCQAARLGLTFFNNLGLENVCYTL